jgi:hypothetical protein
LFSFVAKILSEKYKGGRRVVGLKKSDFPDKINAALF